MREEGIDLTDQKPKILTTDAVQASDVVITMGCGDVCPVFPGKRYLDWQLDDPAGEGLDVVRPIRDEIRRRIEKLITELRPSGWTRITIIASRSAVVPDYSLHVLWDSMVATSCRQLSGAVWLRV